MRGIRKILAIIFTLSIIFMTLPVNAHAYTPAVSNCPNCGDDTPGALVDGTSTFPNATSSIHQRVGLYTFFCNSCNRGWQAVCAVTEAHSFNLSGVCECGYSIHYTKFDEDR